MTFGIFISCWFAFAIGAGITACVCAISFLCMLFDKSNEIYHFGRFFMYGILLLQLSILTLMPIIISAVSNVR